MLIIRKIMHITALITVHFCIAGMPSKALEEVNTLVTSLDEIKFDAPSCDDYWQINQTRDIRWSFPQPSNTEFVRIDISRDYGKTWEPIVIQTENDGHYQWLVAGKPSNSCRIRITSVSSPEVLGEGCGIFTIDTEDGKLGFNNWTVKLAHPAPTGSNLNGVWGSSAENVFAVGNMGTIVHYDGKEWNLVDAAASTTDLFAVWGASRDAVFAVGGTGSSSQILYYDGSNWEIMEQGNYTVLRGVWGTSPDNVIAVGDKGTIIHYDGNAWRMSASGTTNKLSSLWGSSHDNVYAVGSNNTILHYDGIAWNPEALNISGTVHLSGIWGSSPENIYAVGRMQHYFTYSPIVLKYDGATWTIMQSINYLGEFYGIWGNSNSNMYATGSISGWDTYKFDGTSWKFSLPNGPSSGNRKYSLKAVWGSPEGIVFIVGEKGSIFKSNGDKWDTISNMFSFETLNALYISPKSITTVGNNATSINGVFSRATKRFAWYKSAMGYFYRDLSSVWAISDNGFAVSSDSIVQSSPKWHIVQTFPENYKTVWGFSPADVFLVGSKIQHYDGHEWTSMTIDPLPVTSLNLQAIWGESHDSLFAAGGKIILRFNGDRWMAMDNGLPPDDAISIRDLWGTSASNVFAVGSGYGGGIILHFDGAKWKRMTNLPAKTPLLNSIWGSSPYNIFSVGEHGTILRYNGAEWTIIPNRHQYTLNHVRGRGTTFFTVGAEGTILHIHNGIADDDNDGLSNMIEEAGCTAILDGDTDDDGIQDSDEDLNQNGSVDSGETNPCDSDTDDDGIQDGTEMGFIPFHVGWDTDKAMFQPDMDTESLTDPLAPDTDGDGVRDGDEDVNHNGRVDPGERNPLLRDPIGDVDNNGSFDLADAILAIQAVVGMTPSSTIFPEADIDNDGRIGVAEVIHILLKLTDRR